MKTFIIFLDTYSYGRRCRVKTRRVQIQAENLYDAAQQAKQKYGGEMSMGWPVF